MGDTVRTLIFCFALSLPSLATAAPSMLEDPEERPGRAPSRGLFVAGLVTAGVSYGGAAMLGVMGGEPILLIPVAGPAVFSTQIEDSILSDLVKAIFLIDAAAQLTGGVLLVLAYTGTGDRRPRPVEGWSLVGGPIGQGGYGLHLGGGF